MKTALITHASERNGLETALAFGRAGFKVFATMQNLEAGSPLKRKAALEGLDIIFAKLDVDCDSSVATCIDYIIEQHGSLDVLVNNISIERHGCIKERPISDVNAIMNMNYMGLLRCTKAVLPQMRQHRRGIIINVSSLSNHITKGILSAIDTNNLGLESISEAIAQEVKAFNIRVAIIESDTVHSQIPADIAAVDISICSPENGQEDSFVGSSSTLAGSSLMAKKIVEIALNKSWKLRHTVRPYATVAPTKTTLESCRLH